MGKKILGLDLGSNSIGWALLAEEDGKPNRIINIGSRIFIKAVEEKTPTPKNVKRRNARLTRRVLQRRARRKQRMLKFLVSLKLLPDDLQSSLTPEIHLNAIGDPYLCRTKALDEPLTAYELGRVLLHLVQRRGFLSNRKTLLGDMADDPDVLAVLAEQEDRKQQHRTRQRRNRV
ncbi:MAG: type II CRISPR RNA-guided endonuclease Cas9 [Methylovulum miyakonense]|uniref:type II CRISPR RNA-guided endonuclease Cas9 n=1 Tax=Methylovulum miyakonense TaxID=645578 RepID=UPI003BB4E186